MNSRLFVSGLSACAALCLSACNLSLLQSAVVVDVDNNVSTGQTSVFSVTGAWQAKYGYDCSRANSEGVKDSNRFKLDFYNADDHSLAAENPEITLVGIHFKGAVSYSRPGVYYAVVDSPCAWTLQIVDVSGGPGAKTPRAQPAPTGSYKIDIEIPTSRHAITCPADYANAAACFAVEGAIKDPALGDLRLEEILYDTSGASGGGDCSPSALSGTLTGQDGQQLVFPGSGGSYCSTKDTRDYNLAVSSGTGLFEQVSAGKGSVSITSHGTREHLALTLTFPAMLSSPAPTPGGYGSAQH